MRMIATAMLLALALSACGSDEVESPIGNQIHDGISDGADSVTEELE